jgi:hypothetical protein
MHAQTNPIVLDNPIVPIPGEGELEIPVPLPAPIGEEI